MTKLRLVQLCKRYGDFAALSETDLEVREGEFLTLLGPSGSGKTTLLMMVAGLIMPSGGQIWLDGEEATYAPPHRRDIGMVFQNYALFPHMTVAENIAFPLRMRKASRAEIEKRVSEALEMVQLSHTAQRYPSQLSGGQQQRIALARSLVYNPSILLMDEPLGALDKKLRDQMQLEIKQIQTRLGITALYVTHDQEEALTMSDRICLMRDGQVEQIGSAGDLYEHPATEFAANFLGESNIFDGELVAAGDSYSVKLADGMEVEGRGRPGLRVGQGVKVVVRPERFGRVNGFDQAADTGSLNHVAGTVEKVVYVGRLSRVWVLLDTGKVLTWEQTNTSRQEPVRTGDEVRLGWSAADTVVIPA